jgi:hypothetical protein
VISAYKLYAFREWDESVLRAVKAETKYIYLIQQRFIFCMDSTEPHPFQSPTRSTVLINIRTGIDLNIVFLELSLANSPTLSYLQVSRT